jgi:hypothetical protein
MAPEFLHNPGTVARLRTITHFTIQPDPNDPEWLQLRSSALNGKQLFLMLQAVWPAIVGPEYRKFALIHCTHGQHAGVWFHLLPNEDYEPGCHEVMSF